MEKKLTVEEGNKILAEFSDWKYFNEKHGNKIRHWWSTEGISWEGIEPPSFETHWELIMPVVQKILNTDTGTLDVYTLYVSDSLRTADIEKVWEAVTDFIQWLNKKQPPDDGNQKE